VTGNIEVEGTEHLPARPGNVSHSRVLVMIQGSVTARACGGAVAERGWARSYCPNDEKSISTLVFKEIERFGG